MLSRFCKLCHSRVDVPAINLRTYRLSSRLFDQQNDEDDAVPNVQKKKDDRVPIITAKRQQFNFYKGKVFSKFETIPIASQGWRHSTAVGDHFTIHPTENMENHITDESEETMTFNDFTLHSKLIENLREKNIHSPTEIQTNALPKILEGQHTILSAETGCGKTLAYLLPIMNHILRWKTVKEYRERGPNRPFAIIVTPSRELSLQIAKHASELLEGLDISVKTITSGRTKSKMLNPSVRDVDILIGTFGVVSKMVSARIYKLDYVKHIVLDEAHALFHETFDEKLEVFLRRMKFHPGIINDDPDAATGTQLTLVSATKPSEMPEYLNDILDIQRIVEISTSKFQRVMVPQKFMRIRPSDKPMTLLKLVKPRATKQQRVIIFSNESPTCDWIKLFLSEFDIRAVNLHGDMPTEHRKGKFMSFQRGEFNVLSTTNAGARGLDTISVSTVINYDLPYETAEYIHRCGRTGRIGSKCDGRVINLISRPYEIALTQKIERAARRVRAIPILNLLEEKAKIEARQFEASLKEPSQKSRKKRKHAPKKVRKASM